MLSHGKPALTFSLPPGIQQAPPLSRVIEDGRVQFKDGSLVEAEVLMFCTGYNFSFPFLHPEQLHLDIRDHLVAPLYRFILPPAYPSLFFFGICKTICPFPHFHCQVRFSLSHTQFLSLYPSLYLSLSLTHTHSFFLSIPLSLSFSLRVSGTQISFFSLSVSLFVLFSLSPSLMFISLPLPFLCLSIHPCPLLFPKFLLQAVFLLSSP